MRNAGDAEVKDKDVVEPPKDKLFEYFRKMKIERARHLAQGTGELPTQSPLVVDDNVVSVTSPSFHEVPATESTSSQFENETTTLDTPKRLEDKLLLPPNKAKKTKRAENSDPPKRGPMRPCCVACRTAPHTKRSGKHPKCDHVKSCTPCLNQGKGVADACRYDAAHLLRYNNFEVRNPPKRPGCLEVFVRL